MLTTNTIAFVLGLIGVLWIAYALVMQTKGFWSSVVFKVFPFFSGVTVLVYALSLVGIINL